MALGALLRKLIGTVQPHPHWLTADRDRQWRNTLAGEEYVEHLLHVVGGWLDPGNLDAFDYSMTHMPPGGAVVEIGSFLGLSSTIINYALQRHRPDVPFFTCDPFRFAGTERAKSGYFHTGAPAYREWVMEGLRRNIRLFCHGVEPFIIEAYSVDFFRMWGESRTVPDLLGRGARLGGPIGFAYVDGDHTYSGVASDFQAIDRFLLPGGYLFFDDSADDGGYDGVSRLMHELLRHPGYIPLMKTPNYCFRKKS